MSIDRQKVIDTAQKYAAKSQFDKAIVEYMRIVKEDPSDVRILLKIGDLQVRKGSKEDAVATYSRVAKSYDDQGFFLKAIAVYKQILSIDPNLTELYTKLADLYVKLGLVPDAISNLDALAARYARSEQWDRLAAVFRQMVEIDPTNIPSRIKLAELLSKLNKADDAAREFEAGATLLRDAGRSDDWAKVAERLLFHRPNDLVVAKHLAEHYVARQDPKRALPKLQLLFKANAKDVETLELLSSSFRELGQIPKTIWVLKEVARIHHDAGRVEEKLETYRRILELAPNDADAKEGLRGSSRLAKRPSGTGPAVAVPSRRPSSKSMPAVRVSAPAAVTAEPGPSVDLSDDDGADADVVMVDEEVVESGSMPPPAAEPSIKSPAFPRPASMPGSHAVPPNTDTGPVVPLARHREPSGLKHPTPAIPLPSGKRAAPAPVAPTSASQSAAAPSPTSPPTLGISGAPAASGTANATAGPLDVSRSISEADIFLKYGLKQKAVTHLTRALEVEPENLDVLVRIRDLSHDLGDANASAEASLRIAEVVADSDPASAIAEVGRVLEFDPENQWALKLFERLGGNIDAPPADAYEEQAPTGGHDAEVVDAYQVEETYAENPQYEDVEGTIDQTYDNLDAGAAPMPSAAPGSSTDIEEGLDEAEFFVTQGLLDEARETLQTLLGNHPGHRLIVERLEELEALVAAQSAPGEDQSFALAERLAEEFSAAPQDAHFASGGEMIDVESVFEQFKKGVERTVSADDADTHYDLGIAYKEMGLLDDAISEFKIASKSPRKACLSDTMMGLCHMERGDVATAIEHLKRALANPDKSDREELGLYFELGNAYEAAGDLSEAMYFFQKVEKRDPAFRNVRARVQRLAAHVQSGTRSQVAQSPEMDDVDRAFDELLKG